MRRSGSFVPIIICIAAKRIRCASYVTRNEDKPYPCEVQQNEGMHKGKTK